jgi:hypothetical protein
VEENGRRRDWKSGKDLVEMLHGSPMLLKE